MKLFGLWFGFFCLIAAAFLVIHSIGLVWQGERIWPEPALLLLCAKVIGFTGLCIGRSADRL